MALLYSRLWGCSPAACSTRGAQELGSVRSERCRATSRTSPPPRRLTQKRGEVEIQAVVFCVSGPPEPAIHRSAEHLRGPTAERMLAAPACMPGNVRWHKRSRSTAHSNRSQRRAQRQKKATRSLQRPPPPQAGARRRQPSPRAALPGRRAGRPVTLRLPTATRQPRPGRADGTYAPRACRSEIEAISGVRTWQVLRPPFRLFQPASMAEPAPSPGTVTRIAHARR
jgi:hypothetical protein